MTRNIPLFCSQISLFFTNIQNDFDSQSLAIRRPRNMSWLILCVVALFCVSQTNSAGNTPLPYVKGNILRWSIQIIVFSFWFVYNFMVLLENTWFIQGRASKLNLDMHLALTTRIFIRPRLLLQCPFQFHMKDFPIKLPSMKARVTEVVLLSPWSLWDRKVDKQTCNQHM